jgi:DNA polymerase-3 subunit gamma/tau
MAPPVLSLYRRHRPRTFDQVVGQEHIVRTLRNAIELGKVHHAYLFVGSRGTGKTSMAKLLAAALNAEGGPNADFDPESPAARAIANGTSLDVVEMDAASNNSVDDIRELRENVGLSAMGGGSRVYILDEAHMLSNAAWNAFLKTLEEPPPHVVFVLATTEAHKVPATIIDRCHRFDFQRPSLEQIAGVLRRVSAEEGIEAPDAALGMLARAATGSFRDALGTLEQLVTYGGKDVKLDDVLEILGVADAELVLQTSDALVEHDPKAALLAVERLAASGRDVTQFMRDMAAHLRHLYVVQTLGTVPDSFSVTAGHTDKLAAQAERLAQGEVLRAIELLAAGLSAVKDGSDPRIQLELALLKAVQPQVDLSLQALLFRIEQLEARVRGSVPQEEAPPAAEPARAVAAGGGGGGPTNATSTDSISSSPTAGPTAVAAVAAPPAPAPQIGRAEPAAPGAPAVAPAPARAEEEFVRAPEEDRFAPAAAEPAAPVQPSAEDVAGEPEAAPPVVATGPVPDIHRIRDLWPAAVDAVAVENGMVGAFLKAASPVELEDDKLTLAFAPDATFGKKKCEDNRALLQTALRALTGHHVQILCECREVTEAEAPAVNLSHDELVERLKEQFAATEVFDDSAPTGEQS